MFQLNPESRIARVIGIPLFAGLAAALATALVLSACTSDPLKFADWTVPVPEGTPIIEYAAVPMEERTERIELDEALIIGRDSDDPNFIFYRPNEILVDSSGRIFVLDQGNHRIQVFDSEGRYSVTIGQEGEGPGEFQRPIAMTRVGDRLVVNDVANSRVSSWSMEGEYIESWRPDPRLDVGLMFGFANGTIVYTDAIGLRGQPRNAEIVVESVAMNEEQQPHRYAAVPIMHMFWSNKTIQGAAAPIQIPMCTLDVGVDAKETLYVAACPEYQIHAFSLDGSALWALRVPWKRQAIPEQLFDSKADEWTGKLPDFTRADWDDPGDYSALWAIRVDGHGHLYVFPDARKPTGEHAEERPVDVYSAEGDYIFSGMIPEVWDVAHGDFVYKLRLNDETEEHEVVRYRLVEPF